MPDPSNPPPPSSESPPPSAGADSSPPPAASPGASGPPGATEGTGASAAASAPGGVTVGSIALPHRVGRLPLYVAPTTEDAFNTIRAPLRPIACWRLEDVRFDFDSSFVGPESKQDFAGFAGLWSSLGQPPFRSSGTPTRRAATSTTRR